LSPLTPRLRSSLMGLLTNMDVLIAVVFVLVVGIIIIPVSPFLLDIMLVINIAFSLLIILSTLFIKEVLHLAAFPSILLMTTMLRLALNISSTRLILTQASAGEVIAAFGYFVVGGNFVVGLIIFLIITVVQFVVITNGAGRIAEVSARFTLDAMPGKQMSIDADLSSGSISDDEARLRRRKLQREADFFGAMDGASKFVRGDAIAGVVIVLINIIGGFAIGMLQLGMDAQTAVQTYITLTVGDGLVAQIPALLISTAAGLLMTRSTAEAGLGQDLVSQFFSAPKVLGIAAFILLVLGLVPALPFFPFFILAGACGYGAFSLTKEEKGLVAREKEKRMQPLAAVDGDDLKGLIKSDLLEVEIGYKLVSLTDREREGDLLYRITAARRRLAAELGMIVRPIRIRDNLQLPANTYVIKLKGNEVARGELMPGYLLALNPDGVAPADLAGIPTQEPTFKLPALWIAAAQKEAAELKGFTVVDATTVLITHLSEIIKSHAAELLGRQEVKEMLQLVKEEQPAIIEELFPDLLSLGEIQKVLQNLLKEQVPLLGLSTILEALADFAPVSKDPDALTEHVRQVLSRTICSRLMEKEKKLHAITLAPLLEKKIADSLQQTVYGALPVLSPELSQKIIQAALALAEKNRNLGNNPVMLVSSRIRLPLRRLLERYAPDLPILSFNEIAPEAGVEAVGVIGENES